MYARAFDALWDHGRPAETEAAFRAVLAEAEARGDAGELAELWTQIARCLGLQLRFVDAHGVLDQVRATIQPPEGAADRAPDPALRVARVRCLLERGRVFNSSGERDRAAPLFHEAWLAAIAIGADYHAVDAAHMMEIASAGEAKLDWNARAIELAEASGDPRAFRWLGALYNNRGWSLHELGRLDEGLAAFERRLSWLRANPPASDRLDRHALDIGIAHWSIAKMFRLLGRLGEALAIQDRLAATAAGESDGFVHEERGECLLALGRVEEARPAFERAHALLAGDPWLKRNEAERLGRLARLGGVRG
jgi:tetratricopeptide (TPR) repeat protein